MKTMTLCFKRLIALTFLAFTSIFYLTAQSKNCYYLFVYFKNNGEDGINYAYSKDGYRWNEIEKNTPYLTPKVGKDKLMRDPFIIRGEDGQFHMVWTVGWNEKGIGYASSKDLINWSQQKLIPLMKNYTHTRNCWAPEIIFDTLKKRYMIYWSSTVEDKFLETVGNGDNGYNNRIYKLTTEDFITFSDSYLLFDPGFNVIDASIVRDKNKYIMFFKDETLKPIAKNLKIAYTSDLEGPYGLSTLPISGSYWAEGPAPIRIGNNWVVYFDKYKEGKFGALTSVDLKKWSDVSNLITLPQGIRHGSIFKISLSELGKLLNKSQY